MESSMQLFGSLSLERKVERYTQKIVPFAGARNRSPTPTSGDSQTVQFLLYIPDELSTALHLLRSPRPLESRNVHGSELQTSPSQAGAARTRP